ncbi:2-aminoadipate transaminase [Oxobacter pfennigii]|uniref:2-aminoadipate transaminase n=1 Tax=Oxobacter pfennigii TaxID=36849 RepID=A0A0N8NTJ5_9CLOT|nr:PLP-dependent aminotransferase family protein [Oxobacter pfennigii]KPU45008.1 2-aminoadipate transaminase [Oxobacter pfennigii]
MDTNLQIYLDKNSKEAMYLQLYKKLKSLIENSALTDNYRLPSIRKMGQHLNVNNSTVINAYKLLEANGYAYSREGSGIYVINKGKTISNIENNRTEFNINPSAIVSKPSPTLDFSSSTPDGGIFPTSWFKEVVNEVLDRDGGQAFGYTESLGYAPLRQIIAQYMNDEGIRCTEDNIQIISGAQQGIDIISRVMIDYGDIIITERPTYTGAIALFKSRGANMIDIPISDRGIDIDELIKVLKITQPKFIYMMSNFQNPTGYSYDFKTKENLLQLAEKYDFFIIEDDYLSELYFGQQKAVTLKSMDTYDRCIFIKSFSKIFMPGIRLGFLIVPSKLREKTLAVKHFTDISSSGFMQRVFDLFIRKDMFINHINMMRAIFKERYEVITEILDKNTDILSYFKPEGGMHLWLKLNKELSSNILYSYSLKGGLIISPGSIFYTDKLHSEYFRLSYASTDIDKIQKGVNVLIKNINEII